jgi:hypothetical protein
LVPSLVLAYEAGIVSPVGGKDRGQFPGLGHPSGAPALRMSSMIRSRRFK